MTNQDLYTYAALSEHIYRRDRDLDQSLKLGDDILGIGTIARSGNLEVTDQFGENLSDLVADDDYYYSERGFTGMIVKYDGKFVVVFRGTDSNISGWGSVWNGLLDYTGIGGDSTKLDLEDAQTNSNLGKGTLEPTQWDDAQALVEKAIELAVAEGGSKADVVVTGQSLGGGLAGLASLTYGIEGIAFAPAPFAKQLTVEAQFYAAQASLSDPQFAGMFSADFLQQSVSEQIRYLEGDLANYSLETVLNSVTMADTIAAHYDAAKAQKLQEFSANASKLDVHTIEGETLSNDDDSLLGEIINEFSDHFEVPVTSYDVGGTLGDNYSDESLHSPALHALVIRTEGESGKEFSALLRGDEDLRGAFIDQVGISGPLDSGREGPAQHDANGLPLDSPDPSQLISAGATPFIVYRALWKEVGVDGGLYDYFHKLYGTLTAGGAAGMRSSYGETSLHSGVTKLSLGVLRDALQGTGTIAEFKIRLKETLNVSQDTVNFAGGDAEGKPFDDRIVVDLNTIYSEHVDHLESIGGATDGSTQATTSKFGFRDINGEIWKAIRDTSGASDAVIQTILGKSLDEVERGEGLSKPWEILVVQGGDDAGGLNGFIPSEGSGNAPDHRGRSHAVFGGNGQNTIDGSSVADYLIGGKADDLLGGNEGDDVLVGGAGNDALLGGAGNDVLIGGDGDQDVVEYENAATNLLPTEGISISVTGNPDTGRAEIVVENDGFGTSDTLHTVEVIAGTSKADEIRFTDISFEELTKLDLTVLGTPLGGTTQQGNVKDVADFSGVSGTSGIKTDKWTDEEGNTYTSVKDTEIVLYNFSEIYGTDGDDELRGDDKLKTYYGGAGDDTLIGGAKTEAIYGGEGNDYLVGGGSLLYGGKGGERDVFKGAAGTVVADAGAEDLTYWGSFQLSGGVQQWWMEGAFAYWAPISSITTILPGTLGGIFGTVLSLTLDTAFMQTFRYAMTESNQLVVELGRKGGEQHMVLENYDVDLSTGLGTGGITVFRQEFVENGTLEQLVDYINLAFYTAFGSGIPGRDPLVIDLDGDGIELTSLGQSSAYFELDGDGFAERTAWVRPDDGFLAIDDNGNGTIDDLGELFGDATTSGFTELAGFDSNADGVIDANDARFAELLVWQDANGNGVSEAGELRTLTEAGITSISLNTRTPTDTDIRGNEIRAEADIAFADGSQSTISDVVLISDQTDTKTLGDTTISTAAQALPELRGYGELTDLRVAMTDNAALLAAVQTFAATTASGDLSSYHSDVIDILFEWAGVSAVAADPLGASFDVQKLAFLEKYTGYEIMDRDANGDPLLTNIDEVLDIWDNTLQETTMRLAVQGPLSAHFAGTSFDSGRDGFMADTAQGLADIYQAILAQLPADPALALAEWNADWAPLLGQFSGSFLRFDGNGLRADFHVASLVRAFDAASPSIGLQDLIDSLPYEADQLAGIYLGTAGDDSLSRQTDIRTSVYVGGAGNDTYTGGLAQDVYVFGTGFGDDLIIDQEASGAESGDRIRFTTLNSADVTFARDGEDLVLTVNGTSDRITVRKQYSAPEITLAGQYATANWGVEDIQFADGEIFEVADIAERIGTGTSASEVIEGTARGDQITGLEGDDTLRGGNNGDIYYFSRGHGNDVIEDNMTNTLLSAPDALIFEGGIREENVAFSRDGNSNDLLLTLDEGGGSILIKDQFYYTPLGYQNKYAVDYRVDSVFFSQGLPLTWLQIQEKLINEATTAGDDTIYGFGTADTFKASAGNDHLLGGDGGDIYHFGLGSGVDIIEDNQRFVEFNLFPGIETFGFEADDELVFGEGISASDVIFTRQGNASDLIITLADSGDQVTIKGYFNATYTWVFGTHWFNRIETLSFADGTTITVTDIVASVLDQVQTDGDDVVYGFSLEDTLDGGLGDDYLSGGNENDVYKFDAGYGHDTIWENLTNIFSGGTDKVVFGAGISAAGTHFNRDADGNLEVTFDGLTDKLTVQGQFSFTETGPFGTQNFGLIETFEFHDGTIVNWEQIQLGILAAQKTDGNDEIVGFHFDDVIEGGLGDDTLKGGNGNDTYIYRAGDGNDTIDDGLFNILTGRHDILDFIDLNSTDVVFSRDASSWSLKIDIPSTGHTITVDRMFPSLNIARYFYAVDEFRFADGVSYSREQVMQMLLDDASTSGNDTIYGFHDDETIDGGAGDDLLIGLSGQDTYVWGVGSGNDVIDDQSSFVRDDNIVAFTGSLTASDLTFERIADTNDLKITIIATGETLTVKKGFNIHPFGYLDFGVHTYTFTDGSSLTYDEIGQMLVDAQATAGNDTITGFGFDDEFDGGAGNDLLIGGEGSDVYIFGVGSGFDSASDINGRLTDPIDQVRIVGGLTAADIAISRDGNDLLIDLVASNDRMRVIDQFAGDYRIGIEEIVFDDGSTISAEELALMVANLTGTAGADTLAGSDLADAIDGLDGDDSLTGNDGSDFLLGGAGNDTIDAGYDEDHLTGGLGDDLLIGRDGSDTYIFHRGDGQDTIQDDTHFYFFEYTDRLEIHGYQPDDIIVTRAAVDSNDIILTFVGTTDRITLVGSLGTAGYDDIEEIVIFSDGTAPDGSPIVVETLWTNAELRARILSDATTSGDDLIVGLKSDDVLVGAEGNDTLTGSHGEDTLTGGAGNDRLEGHDGSDTYIFHRGDGQDVIEDNTHNYFIEYIDRLEIHGYRPDDISMARTAPDSNDVILSFAGTDDSITLVGSLGTGGYDDIEEIVIFTTIEAEDGSTTVVETLWTNAEIRARILAEAVTPGHDHIVGLTSDDNLDGGAGNDTITGARGEDTLAGGAGNDRLEGNDGSDLYVFSRGDGQDVIEDNTHNYFIGYTDRLQIHDYLPSELVLARDPDNVHTLIITFTGTDDQVTLINGLTTGGFDDIEEIAFDDGTVWTMDAVRDMLRAAASTAGDDTIVGFDADGVFDAGDGNDVILSGEGDDTLSGGLGDDTLHGGHDGDTYIFNRGDGSDTIEDDGNHGTDRLEIRGYTPAEVNLSGVAGSGSLLVITFTGTDDQIAIRNTLNDGQFDVIEEIAYDDGTVWSINDVLALLAAGDPGTILGSDIDDSLTGSSGDDVFQGGLGDDSLYGGAGSDQYIYAAGDGSDFVDEEDASTVSVDVLTLIGLNPSDILASREGNDFVITVISTGERIELDEQFYSTTEHWGIEEVHFADGTVWDRQQIKAEAALRGDDAANSITGWTEDNLFVGGLGDDTLHGKQGNDTYIYSSGDGSDVVDDQDASTVSVDVLQFTDINASDVAGSRIDTDFFLTILATGDRIELDSQFYSTTDHWGIEEIRFADGEIWDRQRMRQEGAAYGDSGANTLAGTGGDDIFIGGLAADSLDGGAGSDTYIYASGDGNDFIDDEDASTTDLDILRLTDINAADVLGTRTGDDLFLTIVATGDQIQVDDQFYSTTAGWGLEEIHFADGEIWDRTRIRQEGVYRGDDGVNSIQGTSGDDTFYGGLGADNLYGKTGSDTYIYSSGDGSDFIDEQDASTVSVDILRLTDINASGVQGSRIDTDFFLTILATGDRIEFDAQLYSTTDHWGLEEVHFADGEIWDRARIRQEAVYRGDDGVNSIHGTSDDEIFNGGLGDDNLYGKTGSDTYIYSSGDGSDFIDEQDGSTVSVDILRLTDINASGVQGSRIDTDFFLTILATGHRIEFDAQLYSTTAHWGLEEVHFADGEIWDRARIRQEAVIRGDDGANSLYGTGGDDIYEGGLGDDNLYGKAGSDTYIYSSGDGSDWLDEQDASTVSVDILRLTDINASGVQGSRIDTDFFLTILATGDRIEFDAQFYSTTDHWGIEEVHFADGEIWDRARIRAEGVIRGDDGNNSLYGTGGDDVYAGGLGNDNLYGAGGSDTYLYASGDGNDWLDEEGPSTSETDVLKLTDLNQDDIYLTRSGDDLMVNIIATGEHVEVDQHYWNTTDHYGIEEIHFADGTVWDRVAFEDRLNDNYLVGTAGADTLDGGIGDDRLLGEGGADSLIGGDGNDRLTGGLGDDILQGDAGSDTFVFGASETGTDQILDFTAGAATDDVIEFDSATFANFAEVYAAATDDGTDTTIVVDASHSIVLNGVLTGQLHDDDFIFV